MAYVNIATYRFLPLGNLDQRRTELRRACKKHQLKGTILLSPEGINVFVAGQRENTDALIALLESSLDVSLDVKESMSEHQPFTRMLVKLKREIIAFGQPVSPGDAPRLTPSTLKQWLDEGRPVTLLDTRNDYEIDVGTFRGAVAPGIDHFRDFPGALDGLREKIGEGPVVTFCTGGIRCEKAAPYMRAHGFKDVYQLDGGILRYFEECGDAHYNGECFVFDQRVALNSKLAETSTTQCYACLHPLTPEQQQSPLYVEGKQCSFCYEVDADTRAREIAKRNSAIAESLVVLPGSVPAENKRPLYVGAKFDRAKLGTFLTELHPHVTHWRQRVAEGRLRRRDAPLLWDSILRAGDTVIHIEPASIEPDVATNVRVIYEDDWIVAFDKPSPLPMHPSGRFNRNTLESFLAPVFAPQRLRPAHRLDANTTGLVLFSKSRRIARLLQPQFEAQSLEKTYLVELEGALDKNRVSCHTPVSRVAGPAGRRTTDSPGREAHTRFEAIERRCTTTLCEARPDTGRTNQIRVHALELGHPVVGDRAYADAKAPMTLTINDPVMRLHAWKLRFDHPATEEALTLEAPPPSWARRGSARSS